MKIRRAAAALHQLSKNLPRVVLFSKETPVDVLETPDQGVATAEASRAAARIAALAARLQAVEPGLPPGEIKQRILGLATPLPGGKDGPRILENPRRYFWLE